MIKLAIAPIETEHIRLRLLTETDLPLTLQWRNQDHIRRWFIHSEVITPEQHRTWFERYNQRNDDYVFIIEEQQTLLRPVGQVALYQMDRLNKRAEFGRLLIGEAEARGRGLGRQATQLLLTLAFDYFDLNEVYLEVFKNNIPAISIYQQTGFQTRGEHGNLLLMSLFKPGSVEE